MLDSPTNWIGAAGGNGVANYCVLNPLSTAAFTISNANLNWSITSSASNALYLKSTLAVSSGKWYWEVTPTNVGGGPNLFIGIQDSTYTPSSAATDNVTSGYAYKAQDGNKVTGATSTSYGASYTNNDVIGVALDMDAGTLVFYKNNTSQGTAFSGLSGSYLPLLVHNVGGVSRTTAGSVNYGQRPFAYTPPTGFKALNTLNLPTPTITRGDAYMNATLYTGTGSALSITNSGSSQPDWVWIKNRSSASSQISVDSVRGVANVLTVQATSAEQSLPSYVTALNSNGFSVGTGSGGAAVDINQSGQSYVGWQWQAGRGTTSSNANGSISSTVSVNTTARFSIVSYTGTGANATVGHGLGVAPNLIFAKNRNVGGEDWRVYHSSLGGTKYLNLNTSDAAQTNSVVWNNTNPTSTVFSVGTNAAANGSGNSIIAYVFAPVAGFSAFGSYTGNGSTDGPFVYTGFLPRFVLVKNYSAVNNWWIWDTARNTYNAMNDALVPNLSVVEQSPLPIDCLANGFKFRTSNGEMNNNGNSYIYMAFAENPFNISRAR
jgi:hypothetical protein